MKRHAFCLVILLPLFLIFMNVHCSLAAAAINREVEDNRLDLEIICRPGGESQAGITYKLYRIAEMNDNGEIEITEEFKHMGISTEMLRSSTKGEEISELLISHEKDWSKRKAEYTESTDKNGKIGIQGIRKGLYFAYPRSYYIGADQTQYVPLPFLIGLGSENVKSCRAVSKFVIRNVKRGRGTEPGSGGGTGLHSVKNGTPDIPRVVIIEDDVPLSKLLPEELPHLQELPDHPVPEAMLPQTGLPWVQAVAGILIGGLFIALGAFQVYKKQYVLDEALSGISLK